MTHLNPNQKRSQGSQGMKPRQLFPQDRNPTHKHSHCRNPNHFHFQAMAPTRNIGFGHQVLLNGKWVQNAKINRGLEKAPLRKKDRRFNLSGFVILISICSIVGMIGVLGSQYYHVAVAQNANQTSIIMQQNELIRNQTEMINQLNHNLDNYQGCDSVRATIGTLSLMFNVLLIIIIVANSSR